MMPISCIPARRIAYPRHLQFIQQTVQKRLTELLLHKTRRLRLRRLNRPPRIRRLVFEGRDIRSPRERRRHARLDRAHEV